MLFRLLAAATRSGFDVRTVLIVEDEWAIADWLELLFSEHHFNVLTAPNGRAALDILQRETPDLVLTDFMMPQLDGAGLAAAMRDDPRLSGIPVVVMTSVVEERVKQRIGGHRAYLRKPFREADLLKVIADLFGQ